MAAWHSNSSRPAGVFVSGQARFSRVQGDSALTRAIPCWSTSLCMTVSLNNCAGTVGLILSDRQIGAPGPHNLMGTEQIGDGPKAAPDMHQPAEGTTGRSSSQHQVNLVGPLKIDQQFGATRVQRHQPLGPTHRAPSRPNHLNDAARRQVARPIDS